MVSVVGGWQYQRLRDLLSLHCTETHARLGILSLSPASVRNSVCSQESQPRWHLVFNISCWTCCYTFIIWFTCMNFEFKSALWSVLNEFSLSYIHDLCLCIWWTHVLSKDKAYNAINYGRRMGGGPTLCPIYISKFHGYIAGTLTKVGIAFGEKKVNVNVAK